MPNLSLTFLGSFEVSRDGAPLTRFRSDKVRALLAYLAVEAGRPHSRASLCGLLWPDQPDDAALHNLSQTLLRLREALGEPRGGASALRASRQAIQWQVSDTHRLDVAEFARLAASAAGADLERAAELYRGELLPGFSLPGCAAFEEWLLLTRERFARLALGALEALARQDTAAGRYARAAEHARRQIALDPWREEGHRQLIRALAASGDRAAALAAYERCRQTLRDGLGVEPDPATAALAAQIRAGASEPPRPREGPGGAPRVGPAEPAGPARPLGRPPASLPAPPTPLIGRAAELAELAALLHAPGTRLLTILGPGGMGKTHLAIELARASRERFADGVCFVALAPLAGADELPAALLHALDLQPRGDPAALAIQVLRDRQLLLVLDNVEHVLEVADLVARLLQAAPRLQILATSRERLNLRGEQRYLIGGLAYEPGAPEGDGAEPPAVQLFVQSARRVQPRFRLGDGELGEVRRICRLVLGMPLGLELAAAWVELLPLGAIAAQIERSGDFLAAELRDVPERQRSMRAIFDWSWRLLRADEQRVFRQLAVFRGGFTLEAAQAVAGATPAMLLRLVGKSLVQGSAGRYEVHELLRQFAHEQLGLAQERAAVELRHGQFYLAFVAERERRLFRDQPAQAAAEIRHELDNIRQAWRWAALHGRFGELGRSACSLALFYRLSGAAAEWEQLLELGITRAREQLGPGAGDAAPRGELSVLMALLGSACIQQGKHVQARRWAEQAIALAPASGGVGETHGLLVLGQALRRIGQSERAREVLERAAALARRAQLGGPCPEQLPDTEFVAYNWLCSIALSNDEHAAAARYVEQGMRLCQRLQKTIGMMILRSDLLDIALATGDYAAARPHGEEVLRLAQGLGYRRMEATTLCALGSLARLSGAYTQAQALAAQALAAFRGMGDLVGEAVACHESGYVRLLLGDYAGAQRWLDHALHILRAADLPARELLQHTLLLAQLAHATADDARALGHATQAVAMARRLEGTSSQAQALALLGLAHARLGQPQLAAEAYAQALSCAGEGGAQLRALPHAGLAELALAGGDLAAARGHAELLWHMLAVEQAQLDEPFGAHVACYRVLAATGDARAAALLQRVRRLRDQYAAQIADPALRRSFLDRVASHGAPV